MTPLTKTHKRRLERAGYVSVVVAGVPGWVPAAYAERVRGQVAAHVEDVERLTSEPPRPRGRPKKA